MKTTKHDHAEDVERLTVRLDPDAAEALRQYLDEQGRTRPSKAATVSEAVLQYIAARKGQKTAA